MVTRLNRFVKGAARVLGRTGKTSGEVRQPSTSPEEAKALRKIQSSSEYYGKKLFTCYDHAGLPRTNNGHEHM